MVRAPCCEKMGLKKGPWTQEEDHTLVSYIERHGHGNWRALPKQAGLLRCGKSCRLRWTNYLRPDIKRGNFTKEEEDMIISLHEMLGNRWSAIAARLPGRTDNEIKNVWHTHLKKRRLDPNQHNSVEVPKRKPRSLAQFGLNHDCNMNNAQMVSSVAPGMFPESPDWTSHSDVNSGSDSSAATQSMDSFNQELLEIDESFWNEALSTDATATQGHTMSQISELLSLERSSNDEDRDFWLRIFMEAGELHDLPQL